MQGGKRSLAGWKDKWHQVLAKLYVSQHEPPAWVRRGFFTQVQSYPGTLGILNAVTAQDSKLDRKDCYSWASSAPFCLQLLIAMSYSSSSKTKTTIKLGYKKSFLPSVWLAGLQLILYSCKHSKCSFAAIIWAHLTWFISELLQILFPWHVCSLPDVPNRPCCWEIKSLNLSQLACFG